MSGISELWNTFASDWSSNQFLTGGLVLGVIASVAVWFRKVPGLLYMSFRAKFTVTIQITDATQLFDWVALWVGSNTYAVDKCRRLFADVEKVWNPETERSNLELRVTPAPGRHLLWFLRTPILLHRKQRDLNASMYGDKAYAESYTLIFLTSRRRIVDEFFASMKSRWDVARDEVEIFAFINGDWNRLTGVSKRAMDSVIIPNGDADSVLRDVENFLESEDTYVSLGVPYRRGYLLEGPPGNGKSSLVRALATEVRLPVYFLNLNALGVDDTSIVRLFNMLPVRCIVLMEDIDRVILSGDARSTETSAIGLTLSGLLNVIDGVVAPEGRILFMTTNHAENLDPALIRPGRIDVRICIEAPGQVEIVRMCERFLGEGADTEDVIARVSTSCREKREPISMAAVQGELMRRKFRMED